MKAWLEAIYARARATDLARRSAASHRPWLILFRDGGIGDVVATFPAARALGERHPDRQIVYATRADFASLPVLGRAAERVVPVRSSDRVAAALQRHHPRVAVHRFRYADEEVEPTHPVRHLVDEFAAGAGVTLTDRQPRLHLPASPPPATAALFRRLGLAASDRRWIALHTGPTWAVREWPRASWERLVDELGSTGFSLVQLGARRHFRGGQRADPPLPGVIDARDALDLPGTLWALRQAALLVGIDSGLLHLAGAVGTPVVGLFGPTDPALRLPPRTPAWGVTAALADVPCLGCHHRRPRLHHESGCVHQVACQARLQPSAVAAAIRSALASDRGTTHGDRACSTA